jgi:hypothetical protein
LARVDTQISMFMTTPVSGGGRDVVSHLLVAVGDKILLTLWIQQSIDLSYDDIACVICFRSVLRLTYYFAHAMCIYCIYFCWSLVLGRRTILLSRGLLTPLSPFQIASSRTELLEEDPWEPARVFRGFVI